MRYEFYIVDVFSKTPFGGNQLAVLPDASGITSEGMQHIAREFNFAESTFVLPPKSAANTRQVRIFSPRSELPFAGHPNVGTGCALVMGGHVGAGDSHRLIFEEGVGPVSVAVENNDGTYSGTLTLDAKHLEQKAETPSTVDLASVLSLDPKDVLQVAFASAGLPFCFVHLNSRDAVDRANLDKSQWSKHLAKSWSSAVFFYSGDPKDGGAIYARMCAPGMGVDEDPATGSACVALVGALAGDPSFKNEQFRLSILQGVAMGRPSEIEASASKSQNKVVSISVSGATTFVAKGEIEVPGKYLL